MTATLNSADPKSSLARWWSQLVVSLAILAIGGFVFWKRPHELVARVLMLFCTTIAVQLWCDAYNFQFSLLPWRRVVRDPDGCITALRIRIQDSGY